MVTLEQVASYLGAAEDTIVDAFASVDQVPMIATAEARFVGFVWDKESDLLGQPASHWLDRADVTDDGAVYVLMDLNASGMVFQPCDPEQPGVVPMTDERAQSLVDAMRRRMIEIAVLQQVVAELQAGLGNPAS